MKGLRHWMLAAAAIALTGVMTACDADDEQTDGGMSIELTATAIDIETETRAGTSLLTTLQGKDVNVYLKADRGTIDNLTGDHGTYTVQGYSATHDAYPMLATDGRGHYKPDEATSITAYGLYPTTAAAPSYTGNVTFTIQSNQGTDNGYLQSDLCHAPQITLTATGKKLSGLLPFRHLMAKILIEAEVEYSGTLGDVDYIKKVEMVNVKPTVTFNPLTYVYQNNSSTGLTVSGTPVDVTMYNNASGALTASFACVIPPQGFVSDVAPGTVLFRFTMKDNHEAYYTLPASETFYPGKVYTYQIKLKRLYTGPLA